MSYWCISNNMYFCYYNRIFMRRNNIEWLFWHIKSWSMHGVWLDLSHITNCLWTWCFSKISCTCGRPLKVRHCTITEWLGQTSHICTRIGLSFLVLLLKVRYTLQGCKICFYLYLQVLKLTHKVSLGLENFSPFLFHVICPKLLVLNLICSVPVSI